LTGRTASSWLDSIAMMGDLVIPCGPAHTNLSWGLCARSGPTVAWAANRTSIVSLRDTTG
jgi:hypothetical protein